LQNGDCLLTGRGGDSFFKANFKIKKYFPLIDQMNREILAIFDGELIEET